MTTSQKRYTIDQYNRQRSNKGLPVIRNPFKLADNNNDNTIYENEDGSKTVTPKTPGRPPILPLGGYGALATANSPGPVSRGYGPIIESFGKTPTRSQEEQSEINYLESIFNSEEGQKFIDSIIEQNNEAELVQFSGEQAPTRNPTPAVNEGASTSTDMSQGTRSQAGNPAKRARTEAPVTESPMAADGPAMSGGADGGFDSTSGPDDTLFRGGYKVTPGRVMYSKVHEITLEAIPYTKTTEIAGSVRTITPLARIDWDMPYFYMSPEEFELLPAGSYFDSCMVDIMGITYPTGYPIGGTTAGISTTNHAKILMAGFDLEQKCRGGADLVVSTLNANMIPSSVSLTTETQVDDFIKQQYGSLQSDTDANYTIAGCTTDIPYRLRKFWSIYQPNRATAKTAGFFTETDDEPPVLDQDYSLGQEYFRNMITHVNANNFVWDKDVMRALIGSNMLQYKFQSAPIGDQFPHGEIATQDFINVVGSGENYNMLRNVTNATINGNLTITESIVASSRDTFPKVTYKNRIEQGCTQVKGDQPKKRARQPTFHLGLKAIEKFDPTVAGSRASSFVQARMTIHVKATIFVTLPSYPNRFTRPKFYNTSIEKAIAGIGNYVNLRDSRLVTFGDRSVVTTAPTVDFVDRPLATNNNRPPRSLPQAPTQRVTRSSTNKRKNGVLN